jgi:hypothetical protein
VPISKLHSRILALLAANRNPESYVAGGVPINRDGPRFSKDIDIFHHREEDVAVAAEADAALLASHGFEVHWSRRQPGIFTATVGLEGEETHLDWVADSDFRYFPAIPDPEFGFVLHIADLAVNKIMAAAGRREPRDIVDLLTIHDKFLSIAAVAWAAAIVAPGFTPETLIAEVRRNARYRDDDFQRLASDQPIIAADIRRRLVVALDEAEGFAKSMPTDKRDRLFLKDGVPVQPDPARLADYVNHAPQRCGHWPSSSEIGSAMLEKYTNPDPDKAS